MSEAASLLARLHPVLRELSAYTPSAGDFEVRLDANEAPNLLSESARQLLRAELGQVQFNRYPDGSSARLRAALAQHSGVSTDQVLVGVGSDEIITMLMTSFRPAAGQQSSVLTSSPTFVMYRLSAKIHGHQVVEVPLDSDWDLNVSSLLKAMEFAKPSLVFLASPNNPTGTMVSEGRLRTLIEHARDSLVVIDEAYIDYADRNQRHLLQYPNVAILRTLSKVGFAALRLGWIMARPELLSEIDKVRLPYNVPTLSQRLAGFVVNELGDELERIRQGVLSERRRLSERIALLAGVEVAPAQANFLWLRTERPAEEVFEELKERSILVRSFHTSGGRLKHYLRVTIGLPAENDRFCDALREIV